MNSEHMVIRGSFDELVQLEEAAALRDAASEREYKDGYAAKRRALNKRPRGKHELAVMENNANAQALQTQTKSKWMNPLWWVAGALIVMAWRKK